MTDLLQDQLKDLAKVAKGFSSDRKILETEFQNVRLGRLELAIAAIAQSRPAKKPPTSVYLTHWRELLAGLRKELEPRAVKFLCWEPEVATDPRFHEYLKKHDVKLTARGVQGLVWSCHQKWSAELAKSNIVKLVSTQLEKFEAPKRLISKWKSALPMVMSVNATKNFGEWLAKGRLLPKAGSEEWGIHEQSNFLTLSLQHSLDHALRRAGNEPKLGEYVLSGLLPWEFWPRQDYIRAVGEVILSSIATEDKTKQRIIQFVLGDTRLGDPRLPRNNSNWFAIEEARRRLIQWLSRADIVFFFDHVMPRAKDRHGRKAFWLQYVNEHVTTMQRSRPLLSYEDEARLRNTINRTYNKSLHFGKTDGKSAFLLDFGRVVAIEFADVGACFLYDRKTFDEILPDFYGSQQIRVSTLKQRDLVVSGGRIPHLGDWQYYVSSVLSRYGVRRM